MLNSMRQYQKVKSHCQKKSTKKSPCLEPPQHQEQQALQAHPRPQAPAPCLVPCQPPQASLLF
jgi:hypothetical protein